MTPSTVHAQERGVAYLGFRVEGLHHDYVGTAMEEDSNSGPYNKVQHGNIYFVSAANPTTL